MPRQSCCLSRGESAVSWHPCLEDPTGAQYHNLASWILVLTRSTIEVAHFRYNVFWMTGLLNPKSSECQPCFEKRRSRILGPWDYSSGCDLSFTEVRFRVGYGAPEVRSLRKNRWTSTVEPLYFQFALWVRFPTQHIGFPFFLLFSFITESWEPVCACDLRIVTTDFVDYKYGVTATKCNRCAMRTVSFRFPRKALLLHTQ